MRVGFHVAVSLPTPAVPATTGVAASDSVMAVPVAVMVPVVVIVPGVLPKIHVWTEARDGMVRLWIQDNGIGIAPHHQERIFGMFQRLHGRTEYEGTGVGLAVCRRITDRHGGTITARSKPGEGAAFIAALPLRQQLNGKRDAGPTSGAGVLPANDTGVPPVNELKAAA